MSGGILCLLAFVLFTWKEPILKFNVPITKESFGLFGDFISGVVGSLWALAGVILFYVALTEQRKDFKTNKAALEKQIEALNLQTIEFKCQRDELELARRISLEQSKTLKKQQFETTFFSLLQLRSEILSSLPRDNEKNDYFTWKKRLLFSDFESVASAESVHQQTIQHYTKFYFANKQDLSHYYRSVYRIIKFIEDTGFVENEKQFYAKILRSQFTENELFLLCYNSFTIYGQNFRPLILRYNLLKHLPSISKMEFKKFSITGGTDIAGNRLLYCDFLQRFLGEFISQMKVNRLELLNGVVQEASLRFNDNGPILELNADSLTHLTFTIHLNTENDFIMPYLGLESDVFIDFQEHLFHDLLCFSRYRNTILDIVSRVNKDSKSFSINSIDGFKISTDMY